MNSEQFGTLHIKLLLRLLSRIDACASEEGLSRAEWCRVALTAAADRSEALAARRLQLAKARGADLAAMLDAAAERDTASGEFLQELIDAETNRKEAPSVDLIAALDSREPNS